MALALGKSLEEVYMLSAYEIELWREYHYTNPIGYIRDDYRSALNTVTIANTFGAKLSLDDCLLQRSKVKEMEENLTVAEGEAIILSMFGVS